ncbi:MAG: hypothetical protein EAX86_02495 [Candidatus Heimdallarchaeota archaeon]|nr:hypothetical protein [Candidatus Heimdallarchaeota archaeon]
MSRFIRFFKKIFQPPELTHEAAQEAEKRKKIAQQITDDEIYIQTVRNALKVPDATLADRLTFAFSSLPEVMTNFDYAKNLFLDIIEFLCANDEITSEEIEFYKNTLEGIHSFEEIMMLA